ncbi:MAG: hypothetical protein AAF647_05985 [Pseudomonadota bacterium]
MLHFFTPFVKPQIGAVYDLTPGQIKTFGDPSKPFLSFDRFVEIVQWYRDVHFAPDNVPGFREEIGAVYQVWTHSAMSTYHRHIFPNELTGPLKLSFEIPSLESSAWFPLHVKLFDDEGLYFAHEQKLVIERKVGERFMLTSWRKVPNLRNYLLSQVAQEEVAA